MEPEHAPILAAFSAIGFVMGYITHVVAVTSRANQLHREREKHRRLEQMREAAYRAAIRNELEGRDA